MVLATRDAAPGEEADRLLVNSYMGRHVHAKPDYWSKLLRMLYGSGRLKKYAGAVEDMVDKFSFMMLARDQITAYEATSHQDKRFYVKYFSYTFVYMAKAFLDSPAVFLNEIYQLGFCGGQIDLKKGAFLAAIRNADAELGKVIDKKRNWIDYVVTYRDALIHHHGLYIGPFPTIPEGMHDPVEQTKYILGEHHYMPVDPSDIDDKIVEKREGEFIKVTALVDDWLNESFELFDIGLRFFAVKFELESVIKSQENER